MTESDARNAEQRANWNGAAGQYWAEKQKRMDLFLAPVSAALFSASDIVPGTRAIDIGCGCGDTSLDLAARAGVSGEVLGLDISGPMLARARERTPPGTPARFVEADATTYPFEPVHADLLFSRFGVMFFAEPERAFANMRKALRPGGRVLFACWRAPDENPWVSVPLGVLEKFVPPPVAGAPAPPPADPNAPGPFAFAREARLRRILGDAGYLDIEMQPAEPMLDVSGGHGLEGTFTSAFQVGPASRVLDELHEDRRDAARQALRAALEPYRKGQTVPVGAAIWIVTGRTG